MPQVSTPVEPMASPPSAHPTEPPGSTVRTVRSHVVLLALFAFALKLLFLPAPHSTDLEVHRHWKALTYNLPLSRWYTDESSQWTLDYPPLFAFFEAALARLLAPFDPRLVHLSAHDYAPPRAVALLRGSVLLLDPLLAFCTYLLIATLYKPCLTLTATASASGDNDLPPLPPATLAATLVLLCPALLLVDNVHFQYNALPLALLLLAQALLLRGRIATAALLFTLAAHTKHTLLPLALPFGLYALAKLSAQPGRFAAAVATRAAVVCLAAAAALWAPFYCAGGPALLRLMRDRMLPFHRGLLHANWAPNAWAAAAALDRALVAAGLRLRVPDGDTTTGRIGALRPFAVLPNPTPALCTLLPLPLCAPAYAALVREWRASARPSRAQSRLGAVVTNGDCDVGDNAAIDGSGVGAEGGTTVQDETPVRDGTSVCDDAPVRDDASSLPVAVALTALAAFLTGWHVHEKNVLLALLPLAAAAPRRGDAALAYMLASSAGHLGVLDLVTGGAAATAARTLVLAYHYAAFCALQPQLDGPARRGVASYMAGAALVDAYGAAHSWALAGRLPFLPKLLGAVYGFCGVAAAFIVLVHWACVQPGLTDATPVRNNSAPDRARKAKTQ